MGAENGAGIASLPELGLTAGLGLTNGFGLAIGVTIPGNGIVGLGVRVALGAGVGEPVGEPVGLAPGTIGVICRKNCT